MKNRLSKKRPRDVNQLTKFFVDLVTGNPITEDISPITDKEKNPAAVEPGRLGGLKGGKARRTTLGNSEKSGSK
jgi:hypothetical protein